MQGQAVAGLGAQRAGPGAVGEAVEQEAWVGSKGAECSFGFNMVWGLSRGLSPGGGDVGYPASGDSP